MTVYLPKASRFYHYDFQIKGVRYHGSTHCDTKRAAEEFERRERRKAALPDQSRPPITLDEAAGLYSAHAMTLPSWPTARYMLKALVAGLGKACLLSDIGQRDLQAYLARRRARGEGEVRSNASINREIEVIRAVWNRAKRDRYDVGEMPDWGAMFLKVTAQPPRELSAATEEAALFGALPDDAFDVVRFAILSGWRRSEVIGLRWSDVELARSEARTRIKGGDVVIRPLSAALVAIIASQPKVGPFVFTYVCRKTRGKGIDKRRRLQPARRKGDRYPMTVTTLRLRFAEAKVAGKIEDFRFHDLRHTAATRILRATQNLAVTKEALKHRNIKTTLRYAHVLGDDVRTALDAAMSRNSPEVPKPTKQKA